MATLGTKESGLCREVETRVNVCTVHPQKWLLLRVSRRGEVAVCEGLTVFIYVKNVLCFIYHRQLPSLTQLHTLHLRNTQVKTLWYILPYLFDYKPILAISRDPRLWTCRLGITRTKNKSKTPGYKLRPIHYCKTELLTMGKPNIFGKKSHWLS